jgi:hypothetical protein
MTMSALLGVTVIVDKIGVILCVSHITHSIRKANLSHLNALIWTEDEKT